MSRCTDSKKQAAVSIQRGARRKTCLQERRIVLEREHAFSEKVLLRTRVMALSVSGKLSAICKLLS